jgi:hypothetical protein
MAERIPPDIFVENLIKESKAQDVIITQVLSALETQDSSFNAFPYINLFSAETHFLSSTDRSKTYYLTVQVDQRDPKKHSLSITLGEHNPSKNIGEKEFYQIELSYGEEVNSQREGLIKLIRLDNPTRDFSDDAIMNLMYRTLGDKTVNVRAKFGENTIRLYEADQILTNAKDFRLPPPSGGVTHPQLSAVKGDPKWQPFFNEVKFYSEHLKPST